MAVAIYFHNLDIETKQAILEENGITFLDIGAFLKKHSYEYSIYLDDMADKQLNTDICPIAIYEID